MVALADAIEGLRASGLIVANPIRDFVAAVSVGISDGEPVLDLDYAEDSACGTDMNVVMTGGGQFVEIQGTAEKEPFTREQMSKLLDLAGKGISELVALQRCALAQAGDADFREPSRHRIE
jgi:ribonuclease PH